MNQGIGVLDECVSSLEEASEADFDNLAERITSPEALRQIHQQFCNDDMDSSANRAKVQDLIDFVPPLDPAELEKRGQSDRFNVNWGLVSSMVNEAVGAYLDIWSSPEEVVNIVLHKDVDVDMKRYWEGVLSSEFTRMMRAWNGSMPRMLMLSGKFVTHGVGITWFDDPRTIFFNVSGLDDFKFDAMAQASVDDIEVCTVSRELSPVEIFSKIEDNMDEEWVEGWNVEQVKRAILNARRRDTYGEDEWDFERLSRSIKANRFNAANRLKSVPVIWGVVKELDGRISLYATTKDLGKNSDEYIDEEQPKAWLYRKRYAFDSFEEFMQIFQFSTGNGNEIYTIRGLAYFLYEAGQADNMLRNTLLSAARSNSIPVYTVESGIEAADDLQFVDVGHALIAPASLKSLPTTHAIPLDKSVGFALDSNQRILDRHSGGLANSSLVSNPSARRTEMQVAAELEHMGKMLSFAISLYYPAYDLLMRELVRRAFTATQENEQAKRLVKDMKKRCLDMGVPEEIFSKIDYAATSAKRVTGAGSRNSRVTMFTQLTQFYPEMDAIGQQFFAHDMAREIAGAEASERYFGIPQQRRDHIDQSLIQLENARLIEGDFLDPIDGENKMLHLQGHLAEMEEGLQGVDQGQVDLGEFTLRNIALFKHITDTLHLTSVHETRIGELNALRQRTQQIGEIMDNGMRHLNKLQREGKAMPQEGDDGAQEQVAREEERKDIEHNAKMQRIFYEGMAKLEVFKEASQSKLDAQRAQNMAKVAAIDAQTAAKLRQASLLSRTPR